MQGNEITEKHESVYAKSGRPIVWHAVNWPRLSPGVTKEPGNWWIHTTPSVAQIVEALRATWHLDNVQQLALWDQCAQALASDANTPLPAA